MSLSGKLVSMKEVEKFLSSLSTNEIHNELVATYDEKKIDEILTNYAFNGFAPKTLILIMFNIAATKTRKLNADLFKILLWCALRGPIFREKQMNKTGESGRKEMKDLVNVYGIKTEEMKASDLDSKDITLPRIVACFPWHQALVRMMVEKKGLLPVVVQDDHKLPYYLQFPAAGSLIPAKSDLRERWINWMIDFDSVIRPKASDVKTINKYATAILNSDLFDQDERTKILSSLASHTM